MFDEYNYSYDETVWPFILLIPLIFLNLIRNLKFLAPFSMVANILTGCAMCITFYYIFQDLPSVNTRPIIADWSKLPLFFGTAIFALEGIGVVSSINLIDYSVNFPFSKILNLYIINFFS